MNISKGYLIVGVLGVTLLISQSGFSQTAPAPVNVSLQAMPVTVAAGDYELVNQVLDLPPGSSVPNHSHGGPVVVTVLSGELNVIESGGERIVKAGESWTEQLGYVHAVKNQGSAPVRLVASYLVPKGAARTTMIK